MWVKDIPARVFGALPKNFAIPPMQPPSAMAGAWFVPMSWELQDGEALVIEYEIPPRAPYVGVCLTNSWSEMIDIETRQTSLNIGTIADRRRPSENSALHQGLRRAQLARRQGVSQWSCDVASEHAEPTSDANTHRHSSRSDRRVLRPGATR